MQTCDKQNVKTFKKPLLLIFSLVFFCASRLQYGFTQRQSFLSNCDSKFIFNIHVLGEIQHPILCCLYPPVICLMRHPDQPPLTVPSAQHPMNFLDSDTSLTNVCLYHKARSPVPAPQQLCMDWTYDTIMKSSNHCLKPDKPWCSDSHHCGRSPNSLKENPRILDSFFSLCPPFCLWSHSPSPTSKATVA